MTRSGSAIWGSPPKTSPPITGSAVKIRMPSPWPASSGRQKPAEGYFTSQITPVEIARKRETLSFDQDEYIRDDASLDQLASLRAVFQKDGSVTAGNASGINDGAAAIVLASGDAVSGHGLTPMARIVAYGFGGVAPRVMGMGSGSGLENGA